MTIISKMAAALVVVALVAVAQPACVFACSCRPPEPPAEALANATAVFAGRVTAVAAPADRGGPLPVQVTFAVTRAWKGANQPSIGLSTPASSASCGVDFVEGQEYLVYALESEGSLQTNLCSRTTQLAMAGEDLAALGQGSTPVAGGAETPTTLPTAGALTDTFRRHMPIAGVALLLIVLGGLTVRPQRAGASRVGRIG